MPKIPRRIPIRPVTSVKVVTSSSRVVPARKRLLKRILMEHRKELDEKMKLASSSLINSISVASDLLI
ncbi:hypothetical protein EUTSA_v10024174mg [Eutrema salsugineum]|uniref:Uncharacterized protein n=1 Tax=Eutrema salsugineum TaxID=72664 RepID=V4KF86_EUTSA|nr:hypothetical protein EUTSA_v10024174mg [Eutrema salsugineum]